MRTSAPVLLLALAVSACSTGPGFGDWTLPVPEGTRIVEHDAVSVEERSGHIDLVEDLRLGDDENDPSQAFYRPRDVDADGNGNIYVLDAGNHRVQTYDATGRYLRTMGRAGQGPAEFEGPRTVSIAADRVVVKNRSYLSVWTLSGRHVYDYRQIAGFSTVLGTDGGLLVANHVPEIDFDDPRLWISGFTVDGDLRVNYADLPLAPNRKPAPEFAASRGGMVYVTAVEEYEVLALAADAQARWALRVAWPRRRPDEVADLGAITEKLPERLMPALSYIAVDGHGHLYVYLYQPAASTAAIRPVDVYSSDGRHLFSGTIRNVRWMKARGDHVYAPLYHPGSEEHHVVRYRLAEPF
jgi:hypothetical protein